MRYRSYKDLLRDLFDEKILEKLPRSFDIVGDIALIKIPDELMNYSRYVGEAIMKIHKNVRAVYARRSVSGVYRISEVIHIAGEKKTETIYSENGIRFYVDIEKMYVNPRLSTERSRIVKYVSDNDLVLDLFAGYGAYSLNIAKEKYVFVVASDLNIHAIEAMRRSLRLNKLRGLVEPIHSEAMYLGNILRGNTFDLVIADNPTMIDLFIDHIPKLVKRGGRVIMYILTSDIDNTRRILVEKKLIPEDCIVVREYSATKNIFRCILSVA